MAGAGGWAQEAGGAGKDLLGGQDAGPRGRRAKVAGEEGKCVADNFCVSHLVCTHTLSHTLHLSQRCPVIRLTFLLGVLEEKSIFYLGLKY